MEDKILDNNSNRILLGCRSLVNLLSLEETDNLLEITASSENRQFFNQLFRIERIVDQYLKRNKDLFYIGFLGHFSSGKSSTINSVLKLKKTKDERKVGGNPTDDQITLMTLPENSEGVVRLMRSGRVPIVISTIEDNEFLKNKVVMDTPGSGDPSLFEELVRDSLPLCDLILYCFLEWLVRKLGGQ